MPTNKHLLARNALACALFLAFVGPAIGCGEDDGDSKDSTTDAAGSSGGTDTGTMDAGVAVAIDTADLNVTVQVLGESMNLKGQVLWPTDCQQAAPCPLIIVVGDRDGGAYPTLTEPGKLLAQRTHSAVVVMNLPGTGPGSLRSGGSNDFGGPNHVAAVKEVMKLLSKREFVDATKTGFVTIGTGLIPVARALKLHGANTLKSVLFLVDVEGPTDRCAISQAPEDKGKGIGPQDGPGVTDSSCNFDGDAPHSAVYPAAKDGNPASIVCSKAAWPITKTGEDCKSSWWSGREPFKELKAISVRYQRLQFLHDHRLPSYFASRHAYRAVAASQSRWFTLNNFPPCKSLPDDSFCEGNPCWLSGNYGNGMAPAPFAGSDLQAVSPTALFNDVLPGYVLRAMDEKTFKKCK